MRDYHSTFLVYLVNETKPDEETCIGEFETFADARHMAENVPLSEHEGVFIELA